MVKAGGWKGKEWYSGSQAVTNSSRKAKRNRQSVHAADAYWGRENILQSDGFGSFKLGEPKGGLRMVNGDASCCGVPVIWEWRPRHAGAPGRPKGSSRLSPPFQQLQEEGILESRAA